MEWCLLLSILEFDVCFVVDEESYSFNLAVAYAMEECGVALGNFMGLPSLSA